MALEIHEELLLIFPRDQVFEFVASAENLACSRRLGLGSRY